MDSSRRNGNRFVTSSAPFFVKPISIDRACARVCVLASERRELFSSFEHACSSRNWGHTGSAMIFVVLCSLEKGWEDRVFQEGGNCWQVFERVYISKLGRNNL